MNTQPPATGRTNTSSDKPSRQIDRQLTVAIDGDDTLWHNETLFVATHDKLRDLLIPYIDKPAGEVDAMLLGFERRNLSLYGYGIKGFTLSMIETAIEITGGRIAANDIRHLLDFGRNMLSHPVTLIDGVTDVISELKAAGHKLWLITKGDLFDQESKVARSGIADRFDHIEIVSEKDEATYQRLLDRQGVAAANFVMAGNSLRSDILPVLAIGGRAFHVPYHVTWAHELVHPDPSGEVVMLDSLRELPGKLREA